MKHIFIEVYLDEDVDVLVADLLRARGFVAITTREAGNLHANDADQLAFAVAQQKTLLTHNRADFEGLARTASPRNSRTTGSSSRYATHLTKLRDAYY